MRCGILILLCFGLACKKVVVIYLVEKPSVYKEVFNTAPGAVPLPESPTPPDSDPPSEDEDPVPKEPVATETTNANLIRFNMRDPDRVLNRCYEVDTRTVRTYGLEKLSRFYKPGETDGPHPNTSFRKVGDQEYTLAVANPDEFKCLRSNAGAAPQSVEGEAFLTLEIIGITETGREMFYTVEEENKAGKLSFTIASLVGTVVADLPGRPQVNGIDLSGTNPNYDIRSVAALNNKSPKAWRGLRVFGYKRLLIQNTCGASALKPGEKTVLILRAKDLAKPMETQVVRINVIMLK